jgi:glycosyltransferase involved in cell wall biosynthesis
MPKITIAIPTHELNGRGAEMLDFNFASINKQTYKDFDIVVSDHSSTGVIEDVCKKWSSKLPINYFKNSYGVGSAVANTNNCIEKATGEYIKILLQDDFFCSDYALDFHAAAITIEKKWILCGCYQSLEDDTENLFRPISPYWDNADSMLMGANTMGGPTVLMFPNDKLFMDETLQWLNDVEFYYELYKHYGLPVTIPQQLVVQRLRHDGISGKGVHPSIVAEEKLYCRSKHYENADINIDSFPLLKERKLKLKLNL